MYLLEDGTPLNTETKNAFKRGLTRAYIKLGNTIINQDNYLLSTNYKDEKADPETGQFIGVTSMRELTVKLYNYENTLNLENQEVEYYVGALVGNEYKYIKFGNFIVQKPENQEVNEETSFTALDYMIKFDGDDEYIPQITFPTTLLGLTQDICRQAGVTLGNTDFRNASMQILANPFINGENCRTVLKSIAKLAFSPAYIGQDNKLYIKFDITDSVTEYITTNDFFENKPNDEVKPITAITLRSSEVKASGQTIYAPQEMIDEYGINELIIEEDYLAYTDTLRNAYLTGATSLFGLTYKPLSIDLLGSIYLTFNDVISITNLQENEHITYALNNTHEYNGTLYNTISAPALTETEERYKYEKEDDTYKRKTAIEIDKANQQITAVVANVEEQDKKILEITATVDELNSKISTIADVTTSQETDTAHLSFTGINASEPITIKIYPIIQNISYLYPSTALFPSNTTYLKTRTLRFYNTQTMEVFDYELPCDLYYYDADHYDEFLLDYGDGNTGTCIVNKKVGINADGTTYLLNEQRTISFEYPLIPLTNGDYQVSLLGYEAGYLFVRLMVQNIYTTQFATRVEMNSAITQKANQINLGVDYKLTAYPTITEMNSAINISANSITNTVRETYATKTTVNTLESKIEQKASSISLSVSNGSISAGITISLEDENGNVIDSKSGTIQMTGLVKFTDLSGNGTTTINGANIKTGTISGDRLNVTKLNATSGQIASFDISNTTLQSRDGVTGLTSSEQVAFWSGGGSTHAGHHPFEVTRDGNLYTLGAYTWLNNHHVPLISTLADNFDGIGVQINRIYRNQNTYTFTFEVANSGTWSIQMNPPSDKKLKKNIKDTEIKALEVINAIRFAQFDWKEKEYKKIGFSNFDKHEDFGVIADELEKINPRFVTENEQSDGTTLKTINKQELIYYNSKGLQEVYLIAKKNQEEIEKLKERIK